MPSASLSLLKKRAQLLQQLRAFFYARNIIEVDVPALGRASVTDIHLQSIKATSQGQKLYLQTSPEFYMKRLLAAGMESIFYLGKSYRDEEIGTLHLREFTLLEWYRHGFDEHQLMQELAELFQYLNDNIKIQKLSYKEVFLKATQINPHLATEEQLRTFAKSCLDITWCDEEKSIWLDLIFTHLVEPMLPKGICFIYNYPSCQSALARTSIDDEGDPVARRFEAYWDGIELANGYWELKDVEEQRTRFEHDLQMRKKKALEAVPIDEELLAALAEGLPDCAGVALGVDRLLMCLTGETNIKNVVPFS